MFQIVRNPDLINSMNYLVLYLNGSHERRGEGLTTDYVHFYFHKQMRTSFTIHYCTVFGGVIQACIYYSLAK